MSSGTLVCCPSANQFAGCTETQRWRGQLSDIAFSLPALVGMTIFGKLVAVLTVEKYFLFGVAAMGFAEMSLLTTMLVLLAVTISQVEFSYYALTVLLAFATALTIAPTVAPVIGTLNEGVYAGYAMENYASAMGTDALVFLGMCVAPMAVMAARARVHNQLARDLAQSVFMTIAFIPPMAEAMRGMSLFA